MGFLHNSYKESSYINIWREKSYSAKTFTLIEIRIAVLSYKTMSPELVYSCINHKNFINIKPKHNYKHITRADHHVSGAFLMGRELYILTATQKQHPHPPPPTPPQNTICTMFTPRTCPNWSKTKQNCRLSKLRRQENYWLDMFCHCSANRVSV